MTAYPELLATIARLSRALIAQEDVTSETATARRELIRQAIQQALLWEIMCITATGHP